MFIGYGCSSGGHRERHDVTEDTGVGFAALIESHSKEDPKIRWRIR